MKWKYEMRSCRVFPGRKSHWLCFNTCALRWWLIHFCEVILNTISYWYSCRGELLGGESSRRYYHKDGSIILMRCYKEILWRKLIFKLMLIIFKNSIIALKCNWCLIPLLKTLGISWMEMHKFHCHRNMA